MSKLQFSVAIYKNVQPLQSKPVECLTVRKMATGLVVTFDVQLFAGGDALRRPGSDWDL